MRCQLASCEFLVHRLARHTKDNHDFGWRIAVALLPEGIHATDGARQSVLRSVKIYGSGLPIIRGEDTQVSAAFCGQRVANVSHGFDQLRPTDFLAEVTIDLTRYLEPCRMD